MAKKSEIEGMKELRKLLKKLGDVPQKVVTPASRKGMNIVLKDARKSAPKDTGQLKKGIILKGEKSKNKGKKVYRIAFDPKMNNIFQKKDKDGKVIGYYPVSQEYGFFTKNNKYIPGFRFVHNAFNSNYNRIEKTIVKEMSKNIDKVLKG